MIVAHLDVAKHTGRRRIVPAGCPLLSWVKSFHQPRWYSAGPSACCRPELIPCDDRAALELDAPQAAYVGGVDRPHRSKRSLVDFATLLQTLSPDSHPSSAKQEWPRSLKGCFPAPEALPLAPPSCITPVRCFDRRATTRAMLRRFQARSAPSCAPVGERLTRYPAPDCTLAGACAIHTGIQSSFAITRPQRWRPGVKRVSSGNSGHRYSGGSIRLTKP
jgi:hypothetical protein